MSRRAHAAASRATAGRIAARSASNGTRTAASKCMRNRAAHRRRVQLRAFLCASLWALCIFSFVSLSLSGVAHAGRDAIYRDREGAAQLGIVGRLPQTSEELDLHQV